jgi:hypothetical protein
MTDMDQKNAGTVKPLHTISLEVLAGSSPGARDLTPDPLALEFIFGLGVQGLSPFERLLEGLPAGDEARIELKRAVVPTTFLNLTPFFIELADRQDPLFLTVKVAGIRPAESREVIRAMARMVECGDDCCCGGH